MKKNSQKAVLVIGAGGIGLAAAKRLQADGFRVAVTSKDKNQMKTIPRGLDFYHLDLEKNEEAIIKTFRKIIAEQGGIDVVVYAATAPTEPKHLKQLRWADYEKHARVQARGLFLAAQSLLDRMAAGRKTKFIVLLTEYCIGKPPSGLSDYVSAKYGLMGLAKCLAVELARYGSTVNMLSPGMTQTTLIAGLPPKLVEITADKNPLKRIATTEDVSGVIAFLASDQSDYINGSNITINGGGVML